MRRARIAAAGLVALLLVLSLDALLSLEDYEWVPVMVLGLWLTITASVGALITARQPSNSVGPLLLGAALAIETGLFVTNYAVAAVQLGKGWLPGGHFFAWMSLWATIPGFALLLHVFLRFPSGELLWSRWRWVSRLVTAGVVLMVAGFALADRRIDATPSLRNPLGGLISGNLSSSLQDVGQLALAVTGLLAIVGLFIRFRRSTLTQRQQMKWFLYAVAIQPVMLFLSQAAQMVDGSEEEYLGFLIIAGGLLFLPVSIGVGILRYRLYDIDVVVNKTLVYVLLTAILAALYLGSIVLLQRVLPVAEDSDLAVAASTLAVAGLFQPIRAHVQAFIDRRFYRKKYDTAETLRDFSARLRDQVDLDALGRELVTVVGTTMQPAHASLWLRTRDHRSPARVTP
jgi:hypothetical protein